MNEILKKIQLKLDLIESRLASGMEQDSIECDQLLGDLTCLTLEARELVDHWWREKRHTIGLKKVVKRDINEIDLGDLGL